MRVIIRQVFERLIASSARGDTIELNQIGEAVGDMHISHAEISLLIDELEGAGRQVGSTPEQSAVEALGQVIRAARTLKSLGTEQPNIQQIASQAGLSPELVVQALALAQVMQR